MNACKPEPVKRSLTPSRNDEIDGFLDKVARMQPPVAHEGGPGRLIFAMDATMSRQHTWAAAREIQSQMFAETARIGGLDVQLVYFRGFNECKASRWVSDPNVLGAMMARIDCRGGHTQIGRVLRHVRRETARKQVAAMVYAGDCMEENIDDLARLAGEVGLSGVKVFMFQEGNDPAAHAAFAEIARLTGGAHCRFSAASASTLRDLLTAVAIYAAGGRKALAGYAGANDGAARLLEQIK